GAPISYDLWTSLRALTGWVCDNWHRKDEGVWEVRGGQREFVYSKLMCWVALDRAIRLADKRSFPAPRDRWLKIRDEIYEDIVSKGWNERRQAFVQHYGSESLDAANLMMALTFFMAPTDPRMLATLDATLLPLEKGGLTANSLVYRYNIKEAEDGLSGEEGTFNICTFWLVEALTRAGRHDRSRLEEARLIFEPTILASMRNRPGSVARPLETSLKPSRTWPSAALRSTWTARWGPADDKADRARTAARSGADPLPRQDGVSRSLQLTVQWMRLQGRARFDTARTTSVRKALAGSNRR